MRLRSGTPVWSLPALTTLDRAGKVNSQFDELRMHRRQVVDRADSTRSASVPEQKALVANRNKLRTPPRGRSPRPSKGEPRQGAEQGCRPPSSLARVAAP